MEHQEETETKGFFQSTTAKMMMVGLLSLVLLIPLFFVQDLILERSQRQKEMVVETTSKWGEAIYINGPIIRIPYKDTLTNKVQFAYFFPENLTGTVDAKMQKALERSIYKSNVFSTAMKFSGSFTNPDFSKKNIPNENVYWNLAKIIIQTKNLKSLKDEVQMKLGSQNLTFEPINSNDGIVGLESQTFDYSAFANTTSFTLNINANGSGEIKIIPIGKTTSVAMNSDWNSPSFNGFVAPTTRNVTSTGFTADWKVLHFNRPFAQQYFENFPNLSSYALETDFITPVDEYQQNERASKYGFLVIGLTFLIFFLIQSISKINIHIFQYTMIGIALIMFYTLLISITEHSSFSLAYSIAGSSVVALITLYSISILKNRKFPLFIGIALTVLYTFIYVIIQLEDYALLVGSIGLFCILAAVMYFSRKIEWK
jgi:inner membrane protein